MGFFDVNKTNEETEVNEVNEETKVNEVNEVNEENNLIAETIMDEVSAETGVEDTDEEISSTSDIEPSYDLIISVEAFERFASVIGFIFGLMINWGSLNIAGFMIGLNYKYIMTGSSYTRIMSEVQTIIPAFMLGVLIVHLSLIYFTMSVFVGYAVKSKNINFLDEKFFKRNSIEINVRNYRGAFYELLGIFGNEKKES